MQPIIIIGSGLAGYNVAREFRKYDKTTPLMIISKDKGEFYSKPLLSTALTQQKMPASLVVNQVEEMAQQLSASILTETTVTAVDSKSKQVHTTTQSFSYSQLVFASGAKTKKLPDNIGQYVLTVNNLHDYEQFHEAILNKQHITIIGSGLIGCEFANDLINIRKTVDVISLDPYPLFSLLPELIGRQLQQRLAERGVNWHFRSAVSAIEKSKKEFLVSLSNQQKIATDVNFAAIGIVPDIHLAQTAKLETNKGILVDRYLRSSVEHIFALGDCAEIEGLLLPYVTPLMQCARALAKTLAGELTAVSLPSIPIVVKTPCFPLAICPPPIGSKGEWIFFSEQNGTKALFYDQENKLQGFILTEMKVNERIVLSQQLPMLI